MSKENPGRTHAASISIDPGNYSIKAVVNNGDPLLIRSVYYQIPQGANGLMAKTNSPVIQDGGITRHFGAQALKYHTHTKVVTGTKEDVILPMLQAANPLSGAVSVVVCHHSPDAVRDKIQQSLLGRHQYVRNGRAVDVEVMELKVVHEGYGSYLSAKHEGMVPTEGYTILIDIGGGSWLSSVYDADGDLINHDPHDSFGVIDLAKQIAADTRLRNGLRQYKATAADLGSVMDGLMSGHRYQQTGLSWVDWLPEYLDPWWVNILSTVKTNYAQFLPSTTQFVVTGGGANLVRQKLSGIPLFYIPESPETASVRGMNLLHSEQPRLSIVA